MANCLKGFLSCLKGYDMFPVATNLRYEGETSYKTWIGFVGSMGFYAVFLWAVITIGRSVLSKSEPSIQTQEESADWPSNMTFYPESFPLVLGLETKNPAAFYIDESIYKPYVEEKYRNINGSKSARNIKIVQCDPLKHGIKGHSKDYFQSLFKSSKLYCVDEPTSISGDFNANNFTYIRIGFGICVNSTDNQNSCSPIEQIQSNLKTGYVAVYFPTYNKDFANYSTPVKDVGFNVFTSIGYDYTKFTDVYMEETNIVTDTGLLYSQYKSEKYFLYSDKREMFDLESTPSRFVYFDIKMSKRIVTYNRSYLKIMDFISNVGGFVNVIFVILVMIADPLTQFLYLIDLLNIMYRQGDPKKKRKRKPNVDLDYDQSIKETTTCKTIISETSEKQSMSSKIDMQTSIMLKSLAIDIPKPNGTIKMSKVLPFGTDIPVSRSNVIDEQRAFNFETILKDYQDVVLNKKTFHMNIIQYLCYKLRGIFGMICKRLKNPAYSRYDNWITKIESKMEIKYIFTKLREIDKLKLLLLNKHQLVMFEYLTKPILSDDASVGVSEKLWDMLENPDMYRKDAYVAYEKIREGSTSADKKIIELLDEDIKKILEKKKT